MKGYGVIMLEKLKEIIADQLGIETDEIDEHMSFKDDLGADSLDLVEFVIAIEEEFDIVIPDEISEDIKTVGDAFRYIEEHVEQ